jgi:penicillin-binding protein 2
LVESCDPYFYQLGLKLGAEKIAKHSALFGLGRPTGVGLPQELPGLIPTPTWKIRNYGEIWRDGETVTTSIGQGYVVCTPIQLALMSAAFANQGKIMKPHIVNRIRAHDGRVIFKAEPVVRGRVGLAPADWKILREALVGVVSDPLGTGKKCGIKGLTVAGKTGTSQVIRAREGEGKPEEAPYHERAHAIFVAYVDDRPEKIAVAVVVEHGGSGGAAAAPIARKIIQRRYGFEDKDNQQGGAP